MAARQGIIDSVPLHSSTNSHPKSCAAFHRVEGLRRQHPVAQPSSRHLICVPSPACHADLAPNGLAQRSFNSRARPKLALTLAVLLLSAIIQPAASKRAPMTVASATWVTVSMLGALSSSSFVGSGRALVFMGALGALTAFTPPAAVAAEGAATSGAVGASPAPTRALKRSDGKRWKALQDFARAEIKVDTKKFLQQREQRLMIPFEVDVMTVGLDGDGAYHYRLNPGHLDELLSAKYIDRELCPTIWSSSSHASVCASVSTVDLPVSDIDKALPELETALRSNMKLVAEIPPYAGAPASEPRVSVYDIDAAKIESVIDKLVQDAYKAEGFDPVFLPSPPPEGTAHTLGGENAFNAGGSAQQRMAVVIINPSKQRMNPNVPPEEGQRLWKESDIIAEWKGGKINSTRVQDVESGYIYRYSYNGKGAGQSWVSSHNFVVLDLSAGPVEFGPLPTLTGTSATTRTPRVQPMLMALAMEVEDAHQITLQVSLIHDALASQHRCLLGELAASVSSAIDHLMVPDMLTERIEIAQTLLVSLVVLQDHEEFHLLDPQSKDVPGVEKEIDIDAVQRAMEDLMPKDTSCVMMHTERRLHQLPEVLMAIARARVSWSDPVMLEQPYLGLHRAQHTRIDSQLLLQELKQFVPVFTGQAWALEIESRKVLESFASSVSHLGLRHLTVIVLSLESAPLGLLFENGELVAADRDMVVVIQLPLAKPGASPKPVQMVKLLPKPQNVAPEFDEVTEKTKLYSGHQIDRNLLELDGARDVTAHIIAGLLQSLGGVPPPWQKADSNQPHQISQDWRWAVGCVPYGPYANCTKLSGFFQAAARRNQIISHIETALKTVQKRLDDVDALVTEVYKGPWPEFVAEMVPSNLNESRIVENRHRHWMDVLNSQANGSKGGINPDLLVALENELASVESYLNSLSWTLFSQNWDAARWQVKQLLAAADSFSTRAGQDIDKCKQIASCCSVRHGNPLMVDTFLLVMFIFLGLLFACVVVVILASKNIYKPRPAAIAPILNSFGSGFGGGGNGVSGGYNVSGGYSASGGYGPSSGYNASGGFSPSGGFGPAGGYGPSSGYGGSGRFSASGGYSGYDGYDGSGRNMATPPPPPVPGLPPRLGGARGFSTSGIPVSAAVPTSGAAVPTTAVGGNAVMRTSWTGAAGSGAPGDAGGSGSMTLTGRRSAPLLPR